MRKEYQVFSINIAPGTKIPNVEAYEDLVEMFKDLAKNIPRSTLVEVMGKHEMAVELMNRREEYIR